MMLEPGSADTVTIPSLGLLCSATLRLARDGERRFIGLSIHGDRIRNCRFVRSRAGDTLGR